MPKGEIIGRMHCSTMASSWTEYLSMEVASDRSVTLTRMSYEVIGWAAGLDGQDVEWPEGFDPNSIEDYDEIPDPVAINGKKIMGVEDGIYLGDKLLPHGGNSSATFRPGDADAAVAWVLDYYRTTATVPDHVLAKIRAVLDAS